MSENSIKEVLIVAEGETIKYSINTNQEAPAVLLTGYTIISNLPILHEVHYREDSSTDARWENSLGRLQHVVSGSVLGCVFFICKHRMSQRHRDYLEHR